MSICMYVCMYEYMYHMYIGMHLLALMSSAGLLIIRAADPPSATPSM